MKRPLLLLVYFSLFSFLFAEIDLEDLKQEFVQETRKIEIPNFPHAFNPSIVKWKDRYLLSFRIIPDPLKVSILFCAADSQIGLIWLDEDFKPCSKTHLLKLEYPKTPSRSEDARLIVIADRLFIIYSDNKNPILTDGGFRIYVAELTYEKNRFRVIHNECLSHFDGVSELRREKNWVPFNYQENLLLAYSLVPQKIFRPYLDGSGKCQSFCISCPSTIWEWGELRGGTPGLPIDESRYLAFFHSSLEMPTVHSNGENILHYFMGAYTFSRFPPFEITQMSPVPIVGKSFYYGEVYHPYWKPVRVVFPCGFVIEEDLIWLTYGRQDHEIWIAKIDKPGLLNSLIHVSTLEKPYINSVKYLIK